MRLRYLVATALFAAIAVPAAAGQGVAAPGPALAEGSISLPLIFSDTPVQNDPVADLLVGGAVPSLASPEVAEAVTTSAVKLAAPPAALLLVIQGLAFIGAVRTRRRWALIMLAALAVGKIGLQAIPRLFAAPSPEPTYARTAPATFGPAVDEGQRRASEAHAADLDYIWMLRRAGSEPVLSTLHSIVSSERASHLEAPPSHPSTGYSLPSDIAQAVAPLAQWFILPDKKVTLPDRPAAFALFARPPPTFI